MPDPDSGTPTAPISDCDAAPHDQVFPAQNYTPEQLKGSREQAEDSKPMKNIAPDNSGAIPTASIGDYPAHKEKSESNNAVGSVNPLLKILRFLGGGGLGQVHVAQDIVLGREVAIKRITQAAERNQAAQERFIREAKLTGQLEHPGIVPIHTLGYDPSGRPYYVMKLIKGRTLRDAITAHHTSGTPTTLRELLRRLVDVCNAIAYAHSRRIIHRDIKPENIMIGEYGETLILDWGLAKHLTDKSEVTSVDHSPMSGDNSTASIDGQVLGTPQYMPPEQAFGRTHEHGPLADVYSLGAVLFHILAGQAPYIHKTASEIQVLLRDKPTPRPSAVRRGVSPALEAICMKAMAKIPQQRYASALDLGKDVQRWLDDEPVSVFRDDMLVRATRAGRKHRVAVASINVLIASAIIALIWNTIAVHREQLRTEAAARQARAEAHASHLQFAKSLISEGDTLDAVGRYRDAQGSYLRALHALNDLAESQFWVKLELCDLYHRRGMPPLLTMSGHDGAIKALAFTPDGMQVFSGGKDRQLKLWDVKTGRILHTLDPHQGVIYAIAVSPKGTMAATGGADGTIKLWNSVTFELRGMLQRGESVRNLAFSPDGERLAASTLDGSIALWKVPDDKSPIITQPQRVLLGHSGAVSIAFSGDGAKLLTGGRDKTVTLWDMSTDKPPLQLASDSNEILCVALTKDGHYAAWAGMDGRIHLYSLEHHQSLAFLIGHQGPITSIAFSADGTHLLSASEDQTVKLWDMQSLHVVKTFFGHHKEVYAIAVAPQGDLVVSGGADNAVMLWDIGADSLVRPLDGRTGDAHSISTINSALTVTALDDDLSTPSLVHWDAATGRKLDTLPPTALPQRKEFSRDDQFALTRDDHYDVQSHIGLWNLLTGQQILTLARDARSMALSPNGLTAIFTDRFGKPFVWDLKGNNVKTLGDLKEGITAVAISSDGQKIYCGSKDGMLTTWEISTGARLGSLEAGSDSISLICSSPNGQEVAIADANGNICLDNPSTGATKHLNVRKEPQSFSFSPDQTVLFCTDTGGTLVAWDTATGLELRSWNGTETPMLGITFSGANTAIACDGRHNMELWDFQTLDALERLRGELATVQSRLTADPNDHEALEKLGEWYAWRGRWKWAIEFLERARAGNARISALALARCYWAVGKTASAHRAFDEALRYKEAPDAYLHACLKATYTPEADRNSP